MIDADFGVPFAGTVVDRARRTSTLRGDDGRPFDWSGEFGRTAPRVVDVGCGNGRFLLATAVARPDVDHLGLERIAPLGARAARRADERGLSNVRFVAADAVAWLARLECLDEIHVYHPQPYYDPEEAGLGMVSPLFFERAWSALRPGGLLVLQTDDRPLGRYLLEAARRHFETEVVDGPWPDAPLGRTRREIQARRKKRRILRVRARRREVPLDIAVPPAYFGPGRAGLRRRRRSRSDFV
jgi:tRNA (guanine-N7-)-methyltransferase